MFKECRHVMPSGLRCQSPAMRGSDFCYFHGRTQRPAKPARREARIEFPAALDSNGILKVIGSILNALGSGLISSRRASVLLFGLQLASTRQSSGLAGLAPDNPLSTPIDATGIPDHLLDELNTVLDKMATPGSGKAKTLAGSHF